MTKTDFAVNTKTWPTVLTLSFLFFITFVHVVSAQAPVSNTMSMRNDDTAAFTDHPVQFGRAFVQGEVPQGQVPQVLLNGVPQQTQVDIKNRWEDNSLKFAVISLVLPALNPGQQTTITFQTITETQYTNTVGSIPIAAADMLNNYDFDAVLELANPAEPPKIISARAMLQNGHITKTWTSGPIVTTVVLADHATSRTYDVGWEQQRTFLTRCSSFSNSQCSPSNILEVQDASWVTVGQVLNLEDELVLVQAVNTNGQNTITVQRDYGGMPSETTVVDNYVTSNTWQPTTNANHKSFRPLFIADFWGAPVNKVRVRFIGENTNTEALQDLFYGLTLKTGLTSPTTTYADPDVTHHIGARWTKQFWTTPVSEKLTIDHNKIYLAQTGFVDYYDLGVQPSSTVVSNWYNCYTAGTSCGALSLNNGGNDIFQRSINVYTGMGPGGGRWELGPIPQTNALWINNMDWRMQNVALAMADLAGAWPVHYREGDPAKVYNRDPNTGAVPPITNPTAIPGLGKPISVNAHPTLSATAPFWSYTTNSDKLNIVSRYTKGEANNALWFDGSRQQWEASLGHFYGTFAVVPYLLTGDFYYYEELAFWTSYSVIGDSNHRGPVPGSGAGQAMALTSPWGSRYQCRPFYSRPYMASLAVDPEEKEHYTNAVLDAIVEWLGHQNIPLSQEPTIPQTQWNLNMWDFGRQEWTNPGNAHGNPDSPSPLKFWIYGSGCGNYPVVTGVNQPDFCEASWMIATCAETLHFAERLGYPAGSLMEFVSDFYDWHFTTPGFNPRYLGAYRHATSDTNKIALTTPLEVESYFEPTYQANPCLQPGLPSFCAIGTGENYLSYHLGASARLYGHDQAAYTWLRTTPGVTNAFASGIYTSDPRYAIAPAPDAISCTPNSPSTCSTGYQGICNPGHHICNQQGNGYGPCSPNVPPASQPETCDNLDNDCDGQTDEGCDCQTWFGGQQCSSGQVCFGGSFIAQAGQPNCCGSPGICQNIIIPNGLLAAYTFSEGTGTAATDASGNANHGTLTNGPLWTAGKYDNALNFDGQNDYVQVPDSPSLNPTNQLSLTAWLFDPQPTGGMVISKGIHGDQYYIRTVGSNIRFSINGVDQIERPFTATLGWHHVAGTYDGAALRIYYDGVQLGTSAPATAAIQPKQQPLLIGIRFEASGTLLNPFVGTIDEVRIYDHGLSQAEIFSDMNSILVAPTNLPPQFTSPSTITTNEGILFQTTLTASDPESNPLTFSAQSLPTNAQFDPNTHILSWPISFSQSGTSQAIFTVSDGTNPPVPHTLTITVKDCIVANAQVGWSLDGVNRITGNQNINEGTSVSVLYTDSTGQGESCEGVLFHATLLEDDGPLGSTEPTSPLIDLGTFTVNGGAGMRTWTTTWQEDVNNFWGDADPEYIVHIEALGESTVNRDGPFYLKVLQGDADNDGVVNDCDSNTNALIGTCGCATWDNINNVLVPNPNPGPQTTCPPSLCNQAGCAQGSYPIYQSVPTQCIIAAGSNGLLTGTYQPQPPTNIPQGFTYNAPATCLVATQCTPEPLCSTDSDLDGIMDRDDLCPQTPQGQPVNQYGQPLPTSTEFTGTETTSYATTNLQTTNLVVQNTYGRIRYTTPVNVANFDPVQQTCQPTNIDNAVDIILGSVSVDSSTAPNLNQPSEVTLINQNFNSPVIYFQTPTGPQLCTTCTLTNYQNGKVTFTVSGW